MWMEHWSHWSLYQWTKYNFMLNQNFMEHWHFNMWFSLKYMYLVLSKFLVPGGHLSRHSHICRKNAHIFFRPQLIPIFIISFTGNGQSHAGFASHLVPVWFLAATKSWFCRCNLIQVAMWGPNVLFVGLVLSNILVTSSINCINHS